MIKRTKDDDTRVPALRRSESLALIKELTDRREGVVEIPKVDGTIKTSTDEEFAIVCGYLLHIIPVALESGEQDIGGVLG